MLDAERYPAAEIVELHHQRRELETGVRRTAHAYPGTAGSVALSDARPNSAGTVRAGRGVQPGAPGNSPGGWAPGGQSFTNFVPNQPPTDPYVVAQRVGGGRWSFTTVSGATYR